MKHKGVISEKASIVRTRRVGKGVVCRNMMRARGPRIDNLGIISKTFIIWAREEMSGNRSMTRMAVRDSVCIDNSKGLVSETLVVRTNGFGGVDVVYAHVERWK